jgi:malate dehydrogenase (oxaloacetate-decarboxylating)
VVVQGIGAAGIATANLLMAAGVSDLVGVDRGGIVTPRRKDARDPIFRRLGKQSNPRGLEGDIETALEGADVFIGLSSGDSLSPASLSRMADDAIVFAMANPTPEIDPETARAQASVVATGRSDYPNQINNVLCFPGLFRGLLDARASTINDEMKLAAAGAVADVAAEDLDADHIVPSVFHEGVVPAVAEAVWSAAKRTGAVHLTGQ